MAERIVRTLLVCAVVLALLTPGAGWAQAPSAAPVLSWETGAGKSYVIPTAEILAFIVGLNQVNRRIFETDYDTDAESIWKNLRTAPVLDKDPFSVNQLGHPYQGSVYYGFARSAGLEYWESLLYTAFGSFIWETAGETTKPSINDHISTGIGGSFVGEALFRMSSLLLEGGGSTPGFWRELGAAVLSPPTGFNRLVFGERFRPVFPSRDPAVFVRLRVGAAVTTNVSNENALINVKRQEGSADFSMAYGLPRKPGYEYKRPFDYFLFEFTAVPNADTVPNAIENVTVRGLLTGTKYEWGDNYRGVWGLFGGYDYLSPQLFRVATTNASVGTTAQWWLSRAVALQGTALVGVGFGAAGTVADQDERDYHFGVIPQVILGLRVIFGDRAMLEASGRQYFAAGPDSIDKTGQEIITRGSVGVTVRVHGPHAIGVQWLRSTRDASSPGVRDRHQSVETVTISYNFLGHTRFGAVDGRKD